MQLNLSDKSRFVTVLSVISILVAGYSIYQNLSTLSMQNSPEFQLAKQYLPAVSISPIAIFIEIALDILAIAASIGLLLRMQWGRISFIVVLSVITVWQIYSSVTSYLEFSALLSGNGLGGSLMLIVIGAVLGVGINVYIIRMLSSAEIRSEFGSQK
jgi:hypothetical protein